MLASFTAQGACFDNAAIGSFWASLKKELIYPQRRFATKAEARLAIFEYIYVFYAFTTASGCIARWGISPRRVMSSAISNISIPGISNGWRRRVNSVCPLP